MSNRITFLIILCSFLLSISLLAQGDQIIQIQLYQSTISPGETVQAEIMVNNPVRELRAQDISLYKASGERIPIAPFFSKLHNNHYFLFFEMPVTMQQESLMLKVENIPFLINNVLQQVSQEEEINVLSTPPSLTITPGFLKISGQTTETITLRMKSNDVNTNVVITTPNFITHIYTTPQIVEKDKVRRFTLTADTTQLEENTKENITITYGAKTFTIPVWIVDIGGSPKEEHKGMIEFVIEGTTLTKTVERRETMEGSLFLKNTVNTTIAALELQIEGAITEILTLNQTTFRNIQPFEEFAVYLRINQGQDPEEEQYHGELLAVHDNNVTRLPLTIIIAQETVEPPIKPPEIDPEIEDPQDPPEENTSEELLKEFLPWTEEKPPVVKKTSMTVVFMIVVLVIIAILIFLLSQKKSVKKRTFKQVMRESQRR